MSAGPALELRGLVAGHDGVAVVRDLDLAVSPGEVYALLGSNGSGKTTTLLTASGLLPRLGGEVLVEGEPAGGRARVRPGRVAAAVRGGLAHVPQDRSLFFGLTVAEHLRLASPQRRSRGIPAEVLDRLPELGPLADRRAGLLSGGEQQMLALARALVRRPRVLLVDEMSHGLAPVVVERLLPVLREVADEGCAVVVVEQHVDLALRIADRGCVLARGRCVIEGTAAELAARRSEVEHSYLGVRPA